MTKKQIYGTSCAVLSLIALLGVLVYPNVVYTAREGAGMSYIMTSVLYALPVVAVVALLPRRWAYSMVVGVFGIASIIDLTMVDLFHSYILPGAIISTLMTNTHEATEFYRANWAEALQWLPIVGLCVLSCLTYRRPHYNKKEIAAVATAFVLPMGFVAYKMVEFYQSKLTTRYFVDNRILNRPPYNVFYQSANAVRDLRKRALLAHAKETDFGAVRIAPPPPYCEVYVMAIGESLRYSSLSLNGLYPRRTTPRLEHLNNLLLFDNYYSQGCLTMLSVPMLVTRATPDNFDICYAERSIVEPFRECGFHTFAIVCSNLLADEKYLTDGVDSLIVVPHRMENGRSLSGDKTIAHIVDSLAQRHEKLFVLMQFLGNHSYYTNYEAEYERYRPNSNHCTEAERANCDSLYINSYDNCTRYTDYVLSSIIQAIDRPNTIAAFAFVSDHGENLSKTGGGHGGDCRPKKDEYHVPFLFWYSDGYAEFYPEKVAAAKAHKAAPINGDCMFYSVCDMAGITIDSAYAKPSWSVFATEFSPHPRYVLVPDGVTTIPVE